MLRSRVLSSIDTERLASAVARPGIDPRIWVSYAVLLTDPVLDMTEGGKDVFADIMLLPSGTVETARVGTIYAGNGFGFYAPLYKDDEVLVVAPSGDPDEGLVITQRFWSPADPPPEGLNIEDVTLVVQSDKNLRITVQGAGKVILGGASATRGVARVDDTVAPHADPLAIIDMVKWMSTVTTTLNALSPGALPGVPPVVGRINSGSEKVVSE